MGGPVSTEKLLGLEEIAVGARLRPVSEAGVESLIASITELGMLKDAIHVRARPGQQFTLIAGAHRLEAFRRLGRAAIPARVWSGPGVTDDWCRLMEVDDNLAGAEMSALDQAVFLAERRRLYLRLHPETARGVAGALARWEDANDIVSFASATAEKFGITDRHVQRLVKAGEALDAEALGLLRGAEKPPGLTDLLALSKAPPARRRDAIARFAAGEVPKLAAALRPARPAAPLPPAEEHARKLSDAWSRAPMAAKRRFVAAWADEIAALLADAEDQG